MFHIPQRETVHSSLDCHRYFSFKKNLGLVLSLLVSQGLVFIKVPYWVTDRSLARHWRSSQKVAFVRTNTGFQTIYRSRGQSMLDTIANCAALHQGLKSAYIPWMPIWVQIRQNGLLNQSGYCLEALSFKNRMPLGSVFYIYRLWLWFPHKTQHHSEGSQRQRICSFWYLSPTFGAIQWGVMALTVMPTNQHFGFVCQYRQKTWPPSVQHGF
jgi:hypothetical protein